MINWQFLATAGVFSGLLFIAMLTLILINNFLLWDDNIGSILATISLIIFGVLVLFWVVIGTLTLLSLIWSWGLVV